MHEEILTKFLLDSFDIYYLQFTFSFQELGVLSLNAYFHIWDVETFSPVSISKMLSNI